MKYSFTICMAVSLSLSILLAPLRAADQAITQLDEVDEQYAYVGEYVGTTPSGPVGVRISTQAGKQPMFARVYPGGLPGLGWGTATPEVLTGDLDGGTLSLSGKEASEDEQATASSGRRLRAEGTRTVLIERSGQEIELRKIARRSVTQGKPAPQGAKVLFDGTEGSTSAWKDAKLTDDGLLKAGCESVDPLVGGHLHLEFRTPYMPKSTGQKRGNSGVYLQRRYEIQILESFALEGIENECGAIYRQRRPDLNMALPPLVWQTYDIFFVPAQFSSDGKKLKGTELTVVHNGVPVHYHTLVTAKTGAGRAEGPDPLPLLLQDHGDPIVYRNVWHVPSAALPTASIAARSNALDRLLADAALPTSPLASSAKSIAR